MARFIVSEEGPDAASILESETQDVVVYHGRKLHHLELEEAGALVRSLESAAPEEWSTNPTDVEMDPEQGT